MITAGIDLSASNAKTGVAVLAWHRTFAEVRELFLGADDATMCEVIQRADKTGIDCPLGWPTDFLALLNAHHGPDGYRADDGAGRPLFRACDVYVRTAVKGASPMSVAANLLGSTAMRCADLQGRLRHAGLAVDRSGRTGPIVEVYPAAALRRWGLSATKYKAAENAAARRALLSDLLGKMPWLRLGTHLELCQASDDALDAVLCAVIAGLQVRGLCDPVPPHLRSAAEAEGWIAVPRADSLDAVGRTPIPGREAAPGRSSSRSPRSQASSSTSTGSGSPVPSSGPSSGRSPRGGCAGTPTGSPRSRTDP